MPNTKRHFLCFRGISSFCSLTALSHFVGLKQVESWANQMVWDFCEEGCPGEAQNQSKGLLAWRVTEQQLGWVGFGWAQVT